MLDPSLLLLNVCCSLAQSLGGNPPRNGKSCRLRQAALSEHVAGPTGEQKFTAVQHLRRFALLPCMLFVLLACRALRSGARSPLLLKSASHSGSDSKHCAPYRWFNQLNPALKKDPFTADEVSAWPHQASFRP